MRYVAVLTALLAILTACQPNAEPAEPQLILRAYDVPSAHAPELVSVIRSLLYRGKDQPTRGSASLSPGGHVLVAAPAGIHTGVAELVLGIAAKPPSPPPSVKLSYWLVVGEPAASGSRDGMPQHLGNALDSIEKNTGALRFRLLEDLALTSISGEHAEVGGSHALVRQKATAFSGAVLADLQIGLKGAELKTTVQIPIGKTVVLGQSGYTERDELPGKGGATIFYIIQASSDAG